jgi:hypothetical protein
MGALRRRARRHTGNFIGHAKIGMELYASEANKTGKLTWATGTDSDFRSHKTCAIFSLETTPDFFKIKKPWSDPGLFAFSAVIARSEATTQSSFKFDWIASLRSQ